MDQSLLEILVCPLCKGPLQHDKSQNALICKADQLAFPIKDGIPVMLESEAQTVDEASASDSPESGDTPRATPGTAP